MFTSIEAVWQYITIDREEFDKTHLLEIAYQGAEYLMKNNRGNYKRANAILKVENYKASLPIGAMQIEAVARIIDADREMELDEYADMCAILDYDTNSELDGSDPSTWIPNHDTVDKKVQQLLLSHSMVYLNSLFYKKRFSLLLPSNDPFTRNLLCEDSPNLNPDCYDTFSVTPFKEIETSFTDDYISVAYFSLPVDAHGLLIVPDDVLFFRTLAAYMMWKHFEARANSYEQNANSREAHWALQFQTLASKWRTSERFKTLSFDKIKAIQQRYFNVIQSPVAWNFNYDKLIG